MKRIALLATLLASPALAYELPTPGVATVDNLANIAAIGMICEPDKKKSDMIVQGAVVALMMKGQMQMRGDGEKFGERMVHFLTAIREDKAKDRACAFYDNGTWSRR
ncbi:hypothetical protein [Rhizobium phage RHph_X3_2]|nr:hypothetical protein [Rhizobium phage RHph_X3_2]